MLSDITRSQIVNTFQTEDITVSYEDMANPLRVGTVVEHKSGEFRICWDDEDGGETWSDLRQAGWNFSPAAPQNTDSYKVARQAKAEGKIVTLTAHGWKIETQEGR